jgi:hypothetical protein
VDAISSSLAELREAAAEPATEMSLVQRVRIRYAVRKYRLLRGVLRSMLRFGSRVASVFWWLVLVCWGILLGEVALFVLDRRDLISPRVVALLC